MADHVRAVLEGGPAENGEGPPEGRPTPTPEDGGTLRARWGAVHAGFEDLEADGWRTPHRCPEHKWDSIEEAETFLRRMQHRQFRANCLAELEEHKRAGFQPDLPDEPDDGQLMNELARARGSRIQRGVVDALSKGLQLFRLVADTFDLPPPPIVPPAGGEAGVDAPEAEDD